MIHSKARPTNHFCRNHRWSTANRWPESGFQASRIWCESVEPKKRWLHVGKDTIEEQCEWKNDRPVAWIWGYCSIETEMSVGCTWNHRVTPEDCVPNMKVSLETRIILHFIEPFHTRFSTRRIPLGTLSGTLMANFSFTIRFQMVQYKRIYLHHMEQELLNNVDFHSIFLVNWNYRNWRATPGIQTTCERKKRVEFLAVRQPNSAFACSPHLLNPAPHTLYSPAKIACTKPPVRRICTDCKLPFINCVKI